MKLTSHTYYHTLLTVVDALKQCGYYIYQKFNIHLNPLFVFMGSALFSL
jgi:hypothetical protein